MHGNFIIIFCKLSNAKMLKRQNQQTGKEIYYHISGTVLMIGHGSIGKGFIPMLNRHFTYDRFVIIDPVDIPPEGTCDKFYQLGLTPDNYVKILDQIFAQKKGFCVNLSVGTSSKDIIDYCQSKGILYLDTVKEEWEGFYESKEISASVKSNYGIRHVMLENAKQKAFKSTAVSCCGANPGMVGWFVKKALIDIAKQVKHDLKCQPNTKEEWAKLMKDLGVKGIHVAERDTQTTKQKRPLGHFWNTWSIDGFISEGFYQPAEAGWGTHQKWLPPNARQHQFGNKCGIYLMQPGMNTMIKSWCPTPGPQLAFMITHDESLSIADYYTVQENEQVVFRPTVLYAYHPTQDAISSCFDLLGSGEPPCEEKWKILDKEIVSGADELGVLIYGHGKNAYWYGSQLSIERTRQLITNQNATALQVTSAILAGMVWAIENPEAGLVQTNQMDYKRCLQIQRPYIEPMMGVFTDWNPLKNTRNEFQNDAFDQKDPWQFKNIITHK